VEQIDLIESVNNPRLRRRRLAKVY